MAKKSARSKSPGLSSWFPVHGGSHWVNFDAATRIRGYRDGKVAITLGDENGKAVVYHFPAEQIAAWLDRRGIVLPPQSKRKGASTKAEPESGVSYLDL